MSLRTHHSGYGEEGVSYKPIDIRNTQLNVFLTPTPSDADELSPGSGSGFPPEVKGEREDQGEVEEAEDSWDLRPVKVLMLLSPTGTRTADNVWSVMDELLGVLKAYGVSYLAYGTISRPILLGKPDASLKPRALKEDVLVTIILPSNEEAEQMLMDYQIKGILEDAGMKGDVRISSAGLVGTGEHVGNRDRLGDVVIWDTRENGQGNDVGMDGD